MEGNLTATAISNSHFWLWFGLVIFGTVIVMWIEGTTLKESISTAFFIVPVFIGALFIFSSVIIYFV